MFEYFNSIVYLDKFNYEKYNIENNLNIIYE